MGGWVGGLSVQQIAMSNRHALAVVSGVRIPRDEVTRIWRS